MTEKVENLSTNIAQKNDINKCIVNQQVSDDEIKSKSPCVNLQANISSS